MFHFISIQQFDIIQKFILVFLIIVILNLIRYIFFSGSSFLFIWKIGKNIFQHRKIQNRTPKKKDFQREMLYSLSTIIIFGFTGILIFYLKQAGYTQIYDHISDYGWGYFIFSIIASIFLHDTYFYWVHRLMHHPRIFRYVHLVHHRSTNPTPFAIFSFHPLEAILESAIVPIIVMIMPIHISAITIFLTFSILMNVLGHIGYEFYFRGFTQHPLTWWNNTSTHHNMHHQYFNYNFGLYFNFWDRLMNTNHPDYHKTFETITRQPLFLNKANKRNSHQFVSS